MNGVELLQKALELKKENKEYITIFEIKRSFKIDYYILNNMFGCDLTNLEKEKRRVLQIF